MKHADFRTRRRDRVVWVPTLLGVGVLVMMLVLAAHRLVSPPPDGIAVLPAPVTPDRPAPALSAAATLPAAAPPSVTTPRSPSVTTPPAADRPATTGATSKPPPRPRPAPPPPVTGRYRVVQSFGDGFIGEVLVSNATTAPAGWVVRLRFPAGVGELHTSWVESAPQAVGTREGGAFVRRSAAPVGGGAGVALRFQFAREGAADRPSSCTVDGSPCR